MRPNDRFGLKKRIILDNKKATLELGTKPVGSLLLHYAIPAIIAMTAASLYNMVDSIFIGKGIGPLAISGLAITFPFMNLSGAFGAAIGVGSSTLISVRLGQKDYSVAQKIFGNNITLNIIIGLLFAITCIIFLDSILIFFGASEQTLPYAREYMQIILAGNVFTHLYFGMNAVLRSASKPRQAMIATIFTVVINAILDPIFIYDWGLGLGIRGAAIATILAQLMALCWQFYIFSDKREFLHLKRGIFSLKYKIVKEIIEIGVSPFAMNACSCLVVIFINNALSNNGGDYAVGAYAIGNRLVFIFLMIGMGINQGMQPIIGYNFGAKKFDRVMRTLKYSVIGATAVLTVGWLVYQLLPQICVRLFTDDKELAEMSVRGLRINALLLPIIGYQIVITNFFQSIGKAKISIFLSLSRQLLFLIPAILILSHYFGVDGVWASLPLSDALAALVALWFMLVYMKRFNKERDEIIKEVESKDERNYNYYTPRSGAAPRSMAPQASATIYEKRHNDKKISD